MQEKVDRLEIIKGFPKVVWQYCTFTPEEYEKKKEKLKIDTHYNEIFIPKLFLNETSKKFNGLYGAYDACGESLKGQHYEIMMDYKRNDEREAILENGDMIKYHNFEIRKDIFVRKPEWIFSPRIGWDRMPEEVIKQIADCNCMWDYYRKIVEDENYLDPEVG
jgi:hypothetical protein